MSKNVLSTPVPLTQKSPASLRLRGLVFATWGCKNQQIYCFTAST